jgi:putative flavoprotein involved in K+ transport
MLGQEFLFALASATIPGVCRDAKYLAERIAEGTPSVQGQPSASAGMRSRG